MDALQDVAGHSDNGSVPSSRGQSLNNEANTQSLPGLLRARANSIDADEVERGSLLGRGCALVCFVISHRSFSRDTEEILSGLLVLNIRLAPILWSSSLNSWRREMCIDGQIV